MLFENRARAESFGTVAEAYDRARPTYPPTLIDALLDGRPRRVLDVGCGTGIAAALLAARGCEVLGVEVDARMAQLARAKGLDVEVAAFESWDAAGRSFELVTSAQAWHWIDPRVGADKAAAVLREAGRIALLWNFGDPPEPVCELLGPIYERLAPELDNYAAGRDKHESRVSSTVADLAASGRFRAQQVATFPWHQAYETASWLENLSTHSDHQALAPERLARLLAAVGEAIDSLGGSFEMTYETVLISASKL